jgi:hypothetical protein
MHCQLASGILEATHGGDSMAIEPLHKAGYIKMAHIIPPLDELKRRYYCKQHNSYSHTTNDYNIFCRWIQSIINEEQLSLKEMQIDINYFPTNTIDL